MYRTIYIAITLGLLLCGAPTRAQSGIFAAWEGRVRHTVAEQPLWVGPVVTGSSGISQRLRMDFVKQNASTQAITWNYDNGKGLNLIPWYKTELDINSPAYIQHNSPNMKNGMGDFSMQLKYRLICSNERKRGYSVSASIGGTLPTGSYRNGSSDATITPTVYGGKGFGNMVIQSSIAVVLPAGNTAKLGRPVNWNTGLQYKIGKMWWPEVECNTAFYRGGPNDGRVQTFITPGLMISNVRLNHDPESRHVLVFGAGVQVATSQYHGSNHNLVFTSRLSF